MVQPGKKSFLALAAVAVLLTYLAYNYTVPGPATGPLPSTFTVGGKTFQITYTASTQAQRQEGLMNKKVTDTTTMLFAWPSPGYYQFYMYDTNTSLDIIWIDTTGDTGLVVYIVAGAQPCYDLLTCPRFTPTSPANYAIEAKAGFVGANGIQIGTTIGFG
ncbi:MAG: DUF192 domain-containing protein [Thaumarchaeota archaeon]|nr:DUF192 domain-containing protein [Nitrososphaerota archaeon]